MHVCATHVREGALSPPGGHSGGDERKGRNHGNSSSWPLLTSTAACPGLLFPPTEVRSPRLGGSCWAHEPSIPFFAGPRTPEQHLGCSGTRGLVRGGQTSRTSA